MSSLGFWQLPGASRFLADVAADIRQGLSVALARPEGLPSCPVQELRRTLNDLNWDLLRPNGAEPISVLFERYGGAAPAGTRHVPDELIRLRKFQRQCIHLQGLSTSTWPAWRDFLTAHEPGNRLLPAPHRTVFLLDGGQFLRDAPPPAQPGLRLRCWEDALASLDIRLYAASLFADSPGQPWQRELAGAVAAELSLWDAELCEACRRRTLGELLAPRTWLPRELERRTWFASGTPSPAEYWERGIRQKFNGRAEWHSAWLPQVGDPESELERRLWTAQVTVLFPLLERHRQSLLREHRPRLRLPWPTAAGSIQHASDLELNHLSAQMESNRLQVKAETREFVFWLKTLRNHLAHCEPVPSETLLEQRFAIRMQQV
jgi:hypothetical protein